MKRFCTLLSLVMVLLLLAACSGLTEPTEVTSFTEPVQEGSKVITTVDELLAAIRPGAEIILGEGEFRLDTASDYGQRKGPWYIWNDLGLGNYELQIQYVEGLTIRGAGKGKTSLITAPRSANVLSFVDSEHVTLADMTLGHTEMAEACEGGVIRLTSVEDMKLEGLGLYGCGTLGVMAYEAENLMMTDCEIYECSAGAVHLSLCEDVTIRKSSIHSIGEEMPAQQLFAIWGGEEITISDCEISDNYVQNLMILDSMEAVVLRNNRFVSNRVSEAAFFFYSRGAVLDGNTFEDMQLRNWYVRGSQTAVDASGDPVFFEDPVQETMAITPGEPVPVSTGEQKTVKVKDVEAFLKAIAPDTCITLDTSLLDFSQARSYKTAQKLFEEHPQDSIVYPEDSDYYYWENNYDGPSLVIRNVTNLTIQGKSDDRTKCTLSAVPRYADVLTFENCSAITLSGFTAGHTVEPGLCDGGVFKLENSENILIDNCGMYGCGTEGVFGDSSRNIQIVNSEIYECSYSGIVLNRCDTVAISATLIRDIGTEWSTGWEPGNFFTFWDSHNVTLDGETLDGNYTGN